MLLYTFYTGWQLNQGDEPSEAQLRASRDPSYQLPMEVLRYCGLPAGAKSAFLVLGLLGVNRLSSTLPPVPLSKFASVDGGGASAEHNVTTPIPGLILPNVTALAMKREAGLREAGLNGHCIMMAIGS